MPAFSRALIVRSRGFDDHDVDGNGNVYFAGAIFIRSAAGYASSKDREAALIVQAWGPAGSRAEYLHRTVLDLAKRKIFDRKLWELQKLATVRQRAIPRNERYDMGVDHPMPVSPT